MVHRGEGILTSRNMTNEKYTDFKEEAGLYFISIKHKSVILAVQKLRWLGLKGLWLVSLGNSKRYY